jgi:TonB family protein
MRIYHWLLCVALPLSSVAAAGDAGSHVDQQSLLVAPTPSYPAYSETRNPGERNRTWNGLFELKFDYESGHLREVHVVKSTGDRAMDAHAIGTLKLWQAKPRKLHNILVPVRFKPRAFCGLTKR